MADTSYSQCDERGYSMTGGTLKIDDKSLTITSEPFKLAAANTAHVTLTKGDVTGGFDVVVTFLPDPNNARTNEKSATLAAPSSYSFGEIEIGVDRTVDADDGNLKLSLESDITTSVLTIRAGLNYSQHVGAFRIKYSNAGTQKILKPGDADLDGIVDCSDFCIWSANAFSTGTNWKKADFNGDRVTDGSDINIWNANREDTGSCSCSH
jgi:hypothetical protein